jgi:hypothetical protein
MHSNASTTVEPHPCKLGVYFRQERENVKWIFSPPINFCDTTFFRRKCIMLNNPDATELPLVIQTGKNYTGPVQR